MRPWDLLHQTLEHAADSAVAPAPCPGGRDQALHRPLKMFKPDLPLRVLSRPVRSPRGMVSEGLGTAAGEGCSVAAPRRAEREPDGPPSSRWAVPLEVGATPEPQTQVRQLVPLRGDRRGGTRTRDPGGDGSDPGLQT